MRHRSIRFRLTLWYAVILSAGLGLFGGLTWFALRNRLMAEIDRIANTPCPLAQRERKIAELEGEIDRLMRIEESLVVATGAPRQPGCLPAVVLGVKAIEAPGVCRHVMSR